MAPIGGRGCVVFRTAPRVRDTEEPFGGRYFHGAQPNAFLARRVGKRILRLQDETPNGVHQSVRSGLLLGRVIAATSALVALAALAATPAWSLVPRAVPLRVSLVTIARPDDDPSLIEDASLGLRRAQTEFAERITTTWLPLRARGSDTRTVWEEHASMLSALRHAARSSDLVIARGDLLTDAAIAVATEYPRVRFILQDPIFLERLPSNVVESILWDGEQAFLAGAAAAMNTRSRRIGYLGPLPAWEENAFRAGAYYVSPGTQVIVDFLASTITATGGSTELPTSWRIAGDAGTSEVGYREPRKAEEVALAQFDRGVDIIYSTGGASDAGTYRAALFRDRWVIARGGSHSLGRLPAAWRRRVLAMIVEHGDVVVYQLVNYVLNGLPLLQHLVWRIGDPVLPLQARAVLLDIDAPPRIAGARLTRIKGDLRDGLIGVPYSKQQLATFVKRYAH